MTSASISGKRLVVVLGMHRSGTSALARALMTLGVDLGDSLMPAQSDQNPKGFYEDTDLNALNIEMLNAIGRSWDSLQPIGELEVTKLSSMGYRERAAELLQRKTAASTIFGFKDPRMAKLLAFWQKVFSKLDLRDSYLIALRNPLSVSKSLEVRNGFDAEKSYGLWLSHVINSLASTNGKPRSLVDFDLLVENPAAELERVARKLELVCQPAEVARYASEFLERDLQHSRYELPELESDRSRPPLVYEIYSYLRTNIAGNEDEFTPNLIAAVSTWQTRLQDMETAFRLVDQGEARISELRSALSERDEMLSRAEETIACSNAKMADLEKELEKQQERAQELEDQIAARETRIQGLEDRAVSLELRLEELTSSTSWRVTGPFRRIAGILRRT